LRRELDDVIASASSTTGDDEHDPEGATIGFERAQAQALLDQALAQLTNIDAAVIRRAAGSYGICIDCGQPIAPERLEVLPAAERCVRCESARR
jgi:RNA polymerase-binding transcription factor DksA